MNQNRLSLLCQKLEVFWFMWRGCGNFIIKECLEINLEVASTTGVKRKSRQWPVQPISVRKKKKKSFSAFTRESQHSTPDLSLSPHLDLPSSHHLLISLPACQGSKQEPVWEGEPVLTEGFHVRSKICRVCLFAFPFSFSPVGP